MPSLLRLPPPNLTLPAWGEQVGGTWLARGERASALVVRAGVGRHFEVLLAEARALLRAGDQVRLHERCHERRFLRAVITAWSLDAALARSTMTPGLLAALGPAQRASRLTAGAAVGLLLDHFDHLDTWSPGLFGALSAFVRRAVDAQRTRERGDLVETVRRHGALLLTPDGPRQLAAQLASGGGEPVRWLRSHHLGACVDSRYGRVARDAFHLAWIAAADATRGDHAHLATVTSEVVARQRTDTTDQDRQYFGHQVLTALTAKTTRHPSEAWLEAVTAIGGDPRAQQTDAWRTWWARVPDENRRRAVRWMQGVNLRAFLDGVEQYAGETGNVDMQRMLEQRRRLLIGLYEQDRVDDVRLLLGAEIRKWIGRSTTIDHLDMCVYRDTNKQDTAVVYVDCGDFSLVEGSHNFSLHIYAGGPVPQIADRRSRVFLGTELRGDIPSVFRQRHGQDSYFVVAHQGGAWIHKALDYLRQQGVRLDERALMTPNDFADLMRRRAQAW